MDSILQNALTFFLVTNPIGNSPAIIALVKNFDFNTQRKIMIREGIIALIVALFFQYCAEYFLDLIQVQRYAVTLCGGVLLFLVALHMIFSLSEPAETQALKQEPFIVPIATPLLSGPGLLTIIMLKSHADPSRLNISLAIFIAWIGVLTVMAIAPYLQKILGRRGLIALEQLMGLLLLMMSIDMLVRGSAMVMEILTTGKT